MTRKELIYVFTKFSAYLEELYGCGVSIDDFEDFMEIELGQKKSRTIAAVNSFRIEAYQQQNPYATMKDCAKHFGKSRDWVKPHWSRPPFKRDRVKVYRKMHPLKSQGDCSKELGLSMSTVKRNWK